MIKRRIMSIFLVLSLADQGIAHSMPKIPTADEIMSHVVKGFEGVKDFAVNISAEVNMERAQIPSMHATMFFKRPDKIHFDSPGFLLVPREGLAPNPALLQDRYGASLAGIDTVEGKALYKLLLAAKNESTRLRQMSLWIDPSNWTIAKIETVPYEGRTTAIQFSYELQQGKFWLPSRLVVTFGVVTAAGRSAQENLPPPAQQLEELQRGAPRYGIVTINYSNYRVNAGIDDAIFEKKEN